MFCCECVRLRLCVHAVMVEMQLCEALSQISSSLFKPSCVLVICVRAVTCTFFMKGFPLLAQAAALDRYSRSHRPMARWDLHDVSLTEVDSAIFTSLVIISAFSCFSAACVCSWWRELLPFFYNKSFYAVFQQLGAPSLWIIEA